MKVKNLYLLAIFLLAPLIIFAQGGEDVDLSSYVLDFATFVGTVVLAAQSIKDWGKIKGIMLQIISWLLGIAIALISHFADFGMFAEMSIVNSLLYGVGASLVANGIANIGIVQSIIRLVAGFLKKKK